MHNKDGSLKAGYDTKNTNRKKMLEQKNDKIKANNKKIIKLQAAINKKTMKKEKEESLGEDTNFEEDLEETFSPDILSEESLTQENENIDARFINKESYDAAFTQNPEFAMNA